MSKSKAHRGNHMYKRFLWGSKENPAPIYRCILPGCQHYRHEALMEGAISLCNRCRQVDVTVTQHMISKKIVKIHCAKCTRPTWNKKKEAANVPSVEDVAARLREMLEVK